jgi:hypothetical protein
MFVSLAVKVDMQYEGDFVDVILLYAFRVYQSSSLCVSCYIF